MTDGFAGPAPRTTRWAQYPLPPMLPRPVHKFNQYGHYLLPDPATGTTVGFVRATTAAKVLDDTYNLSRWSTRQQVASVLRLADAAADPLNEGRATAQRMLDDLRDRIGKGNGSNTNDLLEEIDGFAGGKNAAEFGDAVHEWCAALDSSMITVDQVPELFEPWVTAYQKILAHAGLIAVAQYVERQVLNDSGIERVVGTLDRLFMCVATGELYLGDLKTSKADNVKWSWMTWPTQLVGYARARLMWGLDGGWEPMPPVNQDVGLLVHLPSDAPGAANMLALKLAPADAYMATSLTARHHRKNAKFDVPGVSPVPTAEALRYVAAYQAIQSSRGTDDLNAVWDQYQDVWRPELTELGHTVAKLFTVTATA